ncbi:MAG: hypothetical protein M0P71_10550 [Melioribacteraceae bacterium]|nr:hypothetical protein [Melioribacteraceae bacterium]
MNLIEVRFPYKNNNSKEIIYSDKLSLEIPKESKTIILASESNLLYELGLILSGKAPPTEGKIADINQNESVYIIPEYAAFPWMTVKENLLSVNEKYDDKLVKEFGLEPYLENNFDDESYGFRIKLALVMALTADKKNIVLFNPFRYIKTSYFDILMDDLEKVKKYGLGIIVLSSDVQKKLKFDNEYSL